MPGIKALGYVGCNVTNLSAWDAFLETIFALKSAVGGSETRRFSVADYHQLRLTRSDRNGLGYVGWEVESERDLRDFESRLQARGIQFTRGDAELRKDRGVKDLLVLTGPDAVRIELFHGPVLAESTQTTNVSSANTLRLGHVVLASADRVSSMKWYVDVLGLELSDQIFWDGVEACFLRCNPYHHSLALTNPVGDMRGGDLGHFMFEAPTLDDVGRAYDVVRRKQIPIAFTLGRHSNDFSISFYAYSPSGWLVEYGYGGRRIEEPSWQPKFYDSPSLWGHERLPPPNGDNQKQRY